MTMPIFYRQEQLEMFFNFHFAEPERKPPPKPKPTGSAMPDDDLLKKALASKGGDKLGRLMAGDTTGFNSQSEADLSLCQTLAFWFNGDREKIDAVFRQSGLYRDKWDAKHFSDGRSYGDATIDRALARTTEFYRQGRRRRGRIRTI